MTNNIVEYFISLIKIDSESKNEKTFAEKIAEDLKKLGAKVDFDNAHKNTGGNCGNLYAYFPGKIDKEPLLFCAHLDTVKPGNGINPIIKDGLIITDGTTILGSDDKSGIAEIIWAIKDLKENNVEHAPIEILFTISEEIGLLGAKNTEFHRLKSKMGFALDSHHVGEFMTGAPSQNTLSITIYGKEAHAGVAPEEGINAIKVVADAISSMKIGRIDEETTCNIGIISGGVATNIVPNKVTLEGEVRSHNPEKLQKVTNDIVRAFEEAVASYKVGEYSAKADIKVDLEYHSFFIDDSEEIVKLAVEASTKVGLKPATFKGGGGSDANIINPHGLKMIVGGTGMDKVHTVNEQIEIRELENGYRWVKEVILLHSAR